MNHMTPRIEELAFGTPEYDASVALRQRWLRDPLGLQFTDEDRADDMAMRHLGYYLGETMVGCVALLPLDERQMRLRQLIVDPGYERRGIGRVLVERSETLAREAGCTQMILYARDTAVGFYDRLGYQSVGEPFLEIGIVHQKMVKRLQ